MQASVDVVAGVAVRALIASQRFLSRDASSQLAEVPFQAMASTLASASRSAAGRMADASNWLSAAASRAISVTRKREKCAVMPATFASIAEVTGSRTEFEDGVIMPRRLRVIILKISIVRPFPDPSMRAGATHVNGRGPGLPYSSGHVAASLIGRSFGT